MTELTALCYTNRLDDASKKLVQFGGEGGGDRGDLASACYDLALAAARQSGDKELEGTALQHQGCLAAGRRRFTYAATLYQQALQRFQEAGDRGGMMQTYNFLGSLEADLGRLAEALAWYEKSRQLASWRRAVENSGSGAG